jgi:hypothetical protein
MRFTSRMLPGVALLFCIAATALAGPAAPATLDKRVAVTHEQLPMSFEANQGQADPDVRFLARGSGYTLLLSPTEAALGLIASRANASLAAGIPRAGVDRREPNSANQFAILRVQFVGANRSPRIDGLDELRGTSNYYVGNDPAKWHTNVPHYARVRYQNVYPGIDVVYYGNQTQLEHDFVIAPGADPSAIRLNIQGAENITLDGDGNLLLSAPGGEVTFSKPHLYQQRGNGTKTSVHGRYVRRGLHEIGFQVDAHDPRQALVIDPVLAYASYLGGSGNSSLGDAAVAVAAGNSGLVYLTGWTFSANFPVINAAQPTCANCVDPLYPSPDAFVAKIDTTQSGAASLVYSTFLGAGAGGIVPVILNGQPCCVDIAASGYNSGSAIAADALGNAYVAGTTASFNFPIVGGVQLYAGYPCNVISLPGAVLEQDGLPPNCTAGAAFVAKLSASGALLFSTEFGGYLGPPVGSSYWTYAAPYVSPSGIAVDNNGIAYVAGVTGDFDFPTTPGAFQTGYNPFYNLQPGVTGASNGFLVKFDPTKTGSASMIYSTLLNTNLPTNIALDASNDVHLAGATQDGTLVTAGSFSPGPCLSTTGVIPPACTNFIATFDTTQSGINAVVWGTFFPEGIDSLAVGSDGSTYVSGVEYDTNLPPTAGAFDICAIPVGTETIDTACPGTGFLQDIYVSKLNPSGTALIYTARLGGDNSHADYGLPGIALAVDATGNAYITGTAIVSYVRAGVIAIGSAPPPPGTPLAVAPFPGDLIVGPGCLADPGSCSTPDGNGAGAFVTMLNPQGSAIVYSNLLTADIDIYGNSDAGTYGVAVAVDSAGGSYFAGTAYSLAFPVTANAFQATLGGAAGNAYVVKITQSQTTPQISWPAPAAITYGTTLTATQLDAMASVAGTFAYTPPAGTVLGAGAQTLSVTFTPTDTTDYTTATFSVTLTVNKATPTMTWAAPPAIVAGTALTAAQLDATASVAGTFAYTPPAGTVLGAGTQTLSVTFTPTDTTDYTTATFSVTLTVSNPFIVLELALTSLTADPPPGSSVVTTYTAALAVTNQGNVTVSRLEAVSAVLTTIVRGRHETYETITRLPVVVSDVTPGGTATIQVAFPGSVGAPGTEAVLQIDGKYDAHLGPRKDRAPDSMRNLKGTWQFSQQVSLPAPPSSTSVAGNSR